MKLTLVEPLKYLFKDEVRKLGLELNLSKEIISRHPFPGPGLAIRMPGIITKEKINILKEADHYFIKALKEHGLIHKIWQAYAALLPVKTVGVMGDNRTYEYLCLLRAITSEDGMTADFYDFKKSFIQMISNKIVNSIRGINRVVYDVTSKPPSTIELRMKKIKKILNKKNKSKIVCLTAYSKNVAEVVDKYADIVLVGDSLGSVLYNYSTTRKVTLTEMINHSKSVRMGIKKSLMVVDMPYKTYYKKNLALKNARKIIKGNKM